MTPQPALTLSTWRSLSPSATPAELANLREDPQVKAWDQMIPGPDGAPQVKIRVYAPSQREKAPLPCLFFYHGGGFLFGTVYRQEDLCPAVCKARGLRGGLGGVPPGAPVEDARPPGGLLRRPAVGLDQPPDPGGGPGPSGGGRSVGGGQPGRRRGAAGPGPEGTQTLPAGSPLWGAGLPAGDPLLPGDHRPEGLVPGQLPDLLGQGAQPRHMPTQYESPALAKDLGGLPPLFSFIGQLDPGRDENLTYWSRLMAAGVPVECHVFPGCYHCFELSVPEAEVSKQAYELTYAALRRAFSKG